jgi:hypothetical protein
MKDHAQIQAILQLTGHPLEPLVAYELNKMFQQKGLVAEKKPSSPYTKEYQVSAFFNATENFGVDWFNNYE